MNFVTIMFMRNTMIKLIKCFSIIISASFILLFILLLFYANTESEKQDLSECLSDARNSPQFCERFIWDKYHGRR